MYLEETIELTKEDLKKLYTLWYNNLMKENGNPPQTEQNKFDYIDFMSNKFLKFYKELKNVK